MQILGEYRDSTSVFLCMLWSISWFQLWTVNARLSGECSVSSLFFDRVFLQWIGIVVNSVFAAKLHDLFVHFPFVSGTSVALPFFFCCERRLLYDSLNSAGQGFSRFELPIRGALHPWRHPLFLLSRSVSVFLSVSLSVSLFTEFCLKIGGSKRLPSWLGDLRFLASVSFRHHLCFSFCIFRLLLGVCCWVVAESISFLWEIGTRNQEPGPENWDFHQGVWIFFFSVHNTFTYLSTDLLATFYARLWIFGMFVMMSMWWKF